MIEESMSEATLPIGWLDVEIGILAKATWNYKLDDPVKQRKLVANFKRNGQLENLIIRRLDRDYEVINGNHRLDAMTEIGKTMVHVYNMGEISDAHAKRIAVETNETRFDADGRLLVDLLWQIAQDFTIEDLTGTMPYDEPELKRFVEAKDFDWDAFGHETKERKSTTPAPISDETAVTILLAPQDHARWCAWKDRMTTLHGALSDGEILSRALVVALNPEDV